MAATGQLSLTLDPMGISFKDLLNKLNILHYLNVKIFKVSTNQNTLLALAISDLLQNNKSGIGPSKEHSNNAKYSICREGL
jgi:hypothetical protein